MSGVRAIAKAYDAPEVPAASKSTTRQSPIKSIWSSRHPAHSFDQVRDTSSDESPKHQPSPQSVARDTVAPSPPNRHSSSVSHNSNKQQRSASQSRSNESPVTPQEQQNQRSTSSSSSASAGSSHRSAFAVFQNLEKTQQQQQQQQQHDVKQAHSTRTSPRMALNPTIIAETIETPPQQTDASPVVQSNEIVETVDVAGKQEHLVQMTTQRQQSIIAAPQAAAPLYLMGENNPMGIYGLPDIDDIHDDDAAATIAHPTTDAATTTTTSTSNVRIMSNSSTKSQTRRRQYIDNKDGKHSLVSVDPCATPPPAYFMRDLAHGRQQAYLGYGFTISGYLTKLKTLGIQGKLLFFVLRNSRIEMYQHARACELGHPLLDALSLRKAILLESPPRSSLIKIQCRSGQLWKLEAESIEEARLWRQCVMALIQMLENEPEITSLPHRYHTKHNAEQLRRDALARNAITSIADL